MYVCIVITYSKGKDQPGKVSNPARGQLDMETVFFPYPRENMVSRDGLGSPSRVSLLISILRLNLVLTYRDSSRVPRRHPLYLCTDSNLSTQHMLTVSLLTSIKYEQRVWEKRCAR